MKEVQIKVKSVTNAVAGTRLLNSHGISAHYKRSTRRAPDEGCGYSIYTSETEIDQALSLLQEHSVRVYGVE